MVSAYRKAIQSLWIGRSDIITYDSVTDPATKITSQKEVTKLQDQLCHLSFGSAEAVGAGVVAQLSQTIKLFIDPSVDVPPGSKIVITQNGATTEYSRSGVPRIYTHHQEIELELFKGWA